MQFVTGSAAAGDSSLILGSAECRQHIPVPKKQLQRARQSGVKKQKPEEVEMKGQPSEGAEGSED